MEPFYCGTDIGAEEAPLFTIAWQYVLLSFCDTVAHH